MDKMLSGSSGPVLLTRRQLAAAVAAGAMAADPARADMMASEAAGWDTTSTRPVVFEFGGVTFGIPRNYISQTFVSPRYCDEGTRVCGRSYTPTIVALLPDLSAVTPAEQKEEYRVPWPPRNPRVVLFDMLDYSEPQSKGRTETASRGSEYAGNGLRKEAGSNVIHGTTFDNRIVFVDLFHGVCRLTSDISDIINLTITFKIDYASKWYNIDQKVVELIIAWRRA